VRQQTLRLFRLPGGRLTKTMGVPGFPSEFIQRLPDGRQESRAGMTSKEKIV